MVFSNDNNGFGLQYLKLYFTIHRFGVLGPITITQIIFVDCNFSSIHLTFKKKTKIAQKKYYLFTKKTPDHYNFENIKLENEHTHKENHELLTSSSFVFLNIDMIETMASL